MRFLQHRECASHKAVTYHRYKYTSRFIRDIRAASGKQGMACTATVATTMGCIERSLGASLPHRVLHTLSFTTAVEIVKWKGWAFLQKASVTVLLLYYNISRAGREGRFHVGGGHHSPANGGKCTAGVAAQTKSTTSNENSAILIHSSSFQTFYKASDVADDCLSICIYLSTRTIISLVFLAVGNEL